MKRVSPFLILLSGILWGCIGIFVRGLNEKGLYSLEVVLIRSCVTCLVMGIVIAFSNRKLFFVRLKDLWIFFGSGICSIVFFNFCYFKAMTLTSLSVAAVLLYTAPAFVMILSFILFQEKLSVKKIVSLIMTFVGCVLVTEVLTKTQGQVSVSGLLLGLGAGFGYALYSIFGRFAIDKGYHTLTITFYTFLFATIGSLFLADIPLTVSVAAGSFDAMALCIGMGVVVTIFPYLAYTLGLEHVENGRASIIASVEPVTATIVGILVFGESISISGIIGIILVLTALGICNISAHKEECLSKE